MGTPVDWHASAGAEINADSHGVMNGGVRVGSWDFELYTDTLEASWSASGAKGRGWIAARVEGGAAGLLISPWTDGAPDPGRALLASYGGLQGGALRYLPHGLYAGGTWAFRVWTFAARGETTIAVPGVRPVVTGDVVAGYWSEPLHAYVRGGVDATGLELAPHVAFEGVWAPVTTVAPRVEVRAGAGEGQDAVTRTRLGGLNPYVVPVAGAAWAEWWVEDYAAVRVGGRATLHPGAWTVQVGPFADAATFDGAHAEGVGLGGHVGWRRFFADVDAGYAPWIARQEGVSATSVYLETGIRFAR